MLLSEFLEKYENNSEIKQSIILDLEKTKSRFSPEEIQEHSAQIKQLIEYLEQQEREQNEK